MENRIEALRAELRRDFDPAKVVPNDELVEVSPCDKYAATVHWWGSGPTGCRAVVRRTATDEVLATLLGNDQYAHLGWASRQGRDYFLFAEDYEGQSIVDLAAGEVAGYSSPEETFIGTAFHPSPGGNRIAVEGCYWACPYEVVVCDFRTPMALPWPVSTRFDMPIADGYARFGAWTSPTSFTLIATDGTEHVRECPTLAARS